MTDLLVARAAIEDLIHTYALCVRNADPPGCLRLFAPDATFEVKEAKPGNPGDVRTRHKLIDLQAISNHLERTSTTRICPIISNVLIDVLDRTANSSCVLSSLVLSTGVLIVGEYQDSFRYETEWRFVSRIFTILGQYVQRPT
jgi:hypothetical protein